MSKANISVRISETILNVAQSLEFVKDNRFGATDLFIGQIRNTNLGKSVIGVDYDIFDPLAIELIQGICVDACEKFDEDLRIYVEHFKGYLNVGEISIVIAVGAPHREEAFEACRFLIEEIKHKAPIWKKEHYTDGETEWVKGHTLCIHKKRNKQECQ